MAMRCSPNGGAGSRTVVIKLLVNYEPISGSFLFLEIQFLSRLYLLENTGLSMMILWCVIARQGLTC